MDYSEKVKLLAKFKLMVKQQLKKNVDLEKLTSNPEYARAALRELEDAANEEEMLLMVLHMREVLLPADTAPAPAPVAAPAPTTPVSEEKKEPEGKQTYLFGARSWQHAQNLRCQNPHHGVRTTP
jgi:hypothetical protein